MWSAFASAQPWIVQPGEIDFFGMVVPGTWSADDVRQVLTAPSPAGIWTVQSIHPGASSGPDARTYEVLATWAGPQASFTNSSEITYVGRFVWTPDTQNILPTAPPDLPSPVGSKPSSAGLTAAGVVLGFGSGFVLGSYLNRRTRRAT